MKDYNKKLKETKKRLNSTNVENTKHEYFVKDIAKKNCNKIWNNSQNDTM